MDSLLTDFFLFRDDGDRDRDVEKRFGILRQFLSVDIPHRTDQGPSFERLFDFFFLDAGDSDDEEREVDFSWRFETFVEVLDDD